jgi:hypothetical protein
VDAGGTVIPFWDALAFGCSATVFLVSGGGHLLHPRRLARAVRGHRLLPGSMAAVFAVLLAAGEVAVGVAGALALAGRFPESWAPVLLTGTACFCLALGAYVCVLFVMRPYAETCGCAPWSTPLSALSLAPALVTGSLTVLALVASSPDVGGIGSGLLGALWGLTIAALVLAAPAAVPAPREA